jgi:DNA polymerase II large subunit
MATGKKATSGKACKTSHGEKLKRKTSGKAVSAKKATVDKKKGASQKGATPTIHKVATPTSQKGKKKTSHKGSTKGDLAKAIRQVLKKCHA